MTRILLAIIASIVPTTPAPNHCYAGCVDRVIDGDTIVADIHLGWDVWLTDQPIRLRDCWAAEMKEPGGPEAKRGLERLLDFDKKTAGFDPGAPIVFRSPSLREKYGRLLGDVFADGVNIGAEQVRNKLATSKPLPKAGEATP